MKTRNALKAIVGTATLALAVLRVIAFPTAVRAGTDVDLRAGFYTDADAFALGAGLLTPMGTHAGWYFNPNIELAMPDAGSTLTLSGDVHYDFPTTGTVSPYLGAGPTLIRFSPDLGDANTDLGLNLFAGVSGLRGEVRPFVQLKGMFSSGSEVALMGGIRF